MRSGCVRAATSSTHFRRRALRVGAPPRTGAAWACIESPPNRRPAATAGLLHRENADYLNKPCPALFLGLAVVLELGEDLIHFDWIQDHGFSDLERLPVQAGQRFDLLGQGE